MHTVKRKKSLNPEHTLIEVEAPLVAKKFKPGQFVDIRLHEKGERIPLTVFKNYPEKGTITIVFLKAGKTTMEFDTYEEGDVISDVVGPLGKPVDIENFGTVVCVAGGCGAPEVYPIAKALGEAGNHVIGILGFRNESVVMLEDDLKEVTDELYTATEDGSYGIKGLTTDVLQGLIDEGKDIDLVHAVGPAIMLKVVSELTEPYGIRTMVSLNPIMVDATGMCGSCRVRVDGDMRLACVDGPAFDGHKVDFDGLLNRLKLFEEEERISVERFKKGQ
ncbi:ferredoxin-NADP reductase [candidate division MSBL1 archaeon SCGC-AAA261D19]|uniref:Ferredoxin-NADP reductase n=1 Tax=candidate division MSBL1 archaeon SCGC-AAA261D19 TaxID=1698273 RepID=A0A133V6I2_9EURY|nr:ferredoxin-NADP reductase [candidate division MSBL1 archaeon SCGC-AAA261D19]